MRGADQSILLVRDVDGDNDRDLLILEPGSRRPVGVWLNDGAGHFTEGEDQTIWHDLATRIHGPSRQL